jgi:integrase
LVVLNDIAQQVINEVRGQHPVFVFTGPDGKSRAHHMRNRAWKKARALTGLLIRVHDLKHTFGRRLRAARVSLHVHGIKSTYFNLILKKNNALKFKMYG